MAAQGGSLAGFLSTFLGVGGLILGLGLCILGIVWAKRGVTTPVAFWMLGLTLLIPVAALTAVMSGMIGNFNDVVGLGAAVTPADLAQGVGTSMAFGALALGGFVLGLIGSICALVASSKRADQWSQDADQPVLRGG